MKNSNSPEWVNAIDAMASRATFGADPSVPINPDGPVDLPSLASLASEILQGVGQSPGEIQFFQSAYNKCYPNQSQLAYTSMLDGPTTAACNFVLGQSTSAFSATMGMEPVAEFTLAATAVVVLPILVGIAVGLWWSKPEDSGWLKAAKIGGSIFASYQVLPVVIGAAFVGAGEVQKGLQQGSSATPLPPAAPYANVGTTPQAPYGVDPSTGKPLPPAQNWSGTGPAPSPAPHG
jgi:hypothetical protein